MPDGRTLTLYCEGEGGPVVVLESGLGSGAFAWRTVQSRIARTTRVCAYDRAGYYGRSSPAAGRQDAGTEADDLARMLAAAKLPPPYIVVGHSYGGYVARLYASRHPQSLAGLILVDPSSEFQGRRLAQVAPSLVAAQAVSAARSKACAAKERPQALQASCARPAPPDLPPDQTDWWIHSQSPVHAAALAAESSAMETTSSAQLAAERRSLGSTPLIILTRGKAFDEGGLVGAEAEAAGRLWREMHRELLPLSTRAELRVVEGAGHRIQEDPPDAVVLAVEDLLSRARAALTGN